jgi:hypothetical protein
MSPVYQNARPAGGLNIAATRGCYQKRLSKDRSGYEQERER